jgi:DNA-binding CsgD family transcriptional regulator
MKNKSIHIILFNRSEILLKGLYAIVNELGIEPISIGSVDEFFNYPQLLGYIIIILPEDLYEETQPFIESQYRSADCIKYLKFSNSKHGDEMINLNDSVASIQQKIQLSIAALSKDAVTNHTPELTPREIDVLKLVALGYTNKEIANNLFISAHTAISHRKNISEKLGIKTISGLTMYAVIKQIIEIKDINTDNLK